MAMDDVSRKKFLVCVDSDGCAMDTMDIKHKKCFGPYLVEEWGLQKWRNLILDRWNEINLYTVSRGINRFKGLAVMLTEVNQKITAIDGLSDLLEWTAKTKESSNESLEREIERTDSKCLKKALNWSKALNVAIDGLDDGLKTPFIGVKETLEKMHEIADIAIVSSANRGAVTEEWKNHGLINSVDVILTQEGGTKIHCIAKIKKGYDKEKVLMIGDAVGDYKAAEANGIYFFPILVKREKESWYKLKNEAFPLFVGGGFTEKYANNLIETFFDNFGG